MASADWPLDLPKRFLAQGLSYGVKPVALQTQPEIGPARSRRRTTAVIYLASGTLRLERDFKVRNITGSVARTVDQVAEFFDFLENRLHGGTLRFNWVDPVSPPANYDAATFAVSEYNRECLITNGELILRGSNQMSPGGLILPLTMEIYNA